jgi:hypothetical protein
MAWLTPVDDNQMSLVVSDIASSDNKSLAADFYLTMVCPTVISYRG